MPKGVVSAVILVAVLFPVALRAGYDEGVAAYTAGDFEGAAWEFREMAEKGDALSQYYLGLLYEEGQGLPQNYAEARRWYLLAAEKGVADAMYSLGELYSRGKGIEQDKISAYRWFYLADRYKHRLGAQERERLGRQMSPADLTTAKRLIEDYQATHAP